MSNNTDKRYICKPNGAYWDVVDTQTGRVEVAGEGLTIASLLSYRLNGGTLGNGCSELDEIAEAIEARS